MTNANENICAPHYSISTQACYYCQLTEVAGAHYAAALTSNLQLYITCITQKSAYQFDFTALIILLPQSQL
jgi:hypothetical protein